MEPVTWRSPLMVMLPDTFQGSGNTFGMHAAFTGILHVWPEMSMHDGQSGASQKTLPWKWAAEKTVRELRDNESGSAGLVVIGCTDTVGGNVDAGAAGVNIATRSCSSLNSFTSIEFGNQTPTCSVMNVKNAPNMAIRTEKNQNETGNPFMVIMRTRFPFPFVDLIFFEEQNRTCGCLEF